MNLSKKCLRMDEILSDWTITFFSTFLTEFTKISSTRPGLLMATWKVTGGGVHLIGWLMGGCCEGKDAGGFYLVASG